VARECAKENRAASSSKSHSHFNCEQLKKRLILRKY